MAQQHRENPDGAAHAISPAWRWTCRSSVAASRALWVTIRKPQPVRATRSRASAEHVIRGRLVEIAGGLVGEQQQRLYRQRAADRDPLLLAAGQLLGISLQQVGQARAARTSSRMPGRIMAAGNARLEREIVPDIQARDQVELLKHQPEPVAPQRRAAGIGRDRRDMRFGEPDLAAVGLIQSGDQMQQRALAAAGFARQRDAFAGRDAQGPRRAAPRPALRPSDRSWSDCGRSARSDCRVARGRREASSAASDTSARTRPPVPADGTPRRRAGLPGGAGNRLRRPA